MGTTLGGPVAGPPPGLNGVLWQEDYISPAINARFKDARDIRENRTSVESLVNYTLLGQDTVYAGPGQVPTFGINPERLRTRPPLIQDWEYSGEPTPLIGMDTVYGAPGESQAIDWTQFGVPLVYLYKAKGEKNYTHTEPDVNQNPLWLIGKDTFYGDQGESQAVDWTQFGLPKNFAQSLKGEKSYLHSVSDVNQNPLWLIGLDTFYGDPGQSISYLFQPSSPPSRQRGLIEGGLAPNLLNSLLGITSIPGIQSFDASVIRLKPFLQDIASPGLVLTLLAGLDSFYGDQGQVITFGNSQRLLVRGLLLQDWQITGTPNPNAIPEANLPPGLLAVELWPRGYAPILKDYIVQGLVNGVLVAQDAFYGANGQVITFPASEKLRTRTPLHQDYQARGGAILTGADQFYGDSGQSITFGVTEKLRTIPPLHQDYQARGGGILEGADQFYGDSGQSITFGITERLRRLAPLIQDYLKNGGPIPLEIMGPGAQMLEPLPLIRLPLLQHHALVLITNTLLGKDIFYGADGQAITFGITERLRVRPPVLQDYAQKGGQILIGQDTFYGDAGQAITFGITERLAVRQRLNFDWFKIGGVIPLAIEPSGRVHYDNFIPHPRPPIAEFFLNVIDRLIIVPQGKSSQESPYITRKAPYRQDYIFGTLFLLWPIPETGSPVYAILLSPQEARAILLQDAPHGAILITDGKTVARILYG